MGHLQREQASGWDRLPRLRQSFRDGNTSAMAGGESCLRPSVPIQRCPTSKAEPESFSPAGSGPEPSPEQVVPATPPRGVTLREQVIAVINDVLDDPCPEREWAKNQLRQLLAVHPDEPERALLKHLIITRKRTALVEDEDEQAP